MCEDLRLGVKEEQLLQTIDPFRDGQSGKLSIFKMFWVAGREPPQQVATQLESDIIPNFLDLKRVEGKMEGN